MRLQADRRALNITLNSIGTELTRDDRRKLYSNFGLLHPHGHMELASAEDFDQIRAAMEKCPPYQAIFAKVGCISAVAANDPRHTCMSRGLHGCPRASCLDCLPHACLSWPSIQLYVTSKHSRICYIDCPSAVARLTLNASRSCMHVARSLLGRALLSRPSYPPCTPHSCKQQRC